MRSADVTVLCPAPSPGPRHQVLSALEQAWPRLRPSGEPSAPSAAPPEPQCPDTASPAHVAFMLQLVTALAQSGGEGGLWCWANPASVPCLSHHLVLRTEPSSRLCYRLGETVQAESTVEHLRFCSALSVCPHGAGDREAGFPAPPASPSPPQLGVQGFISIFTLSTCR